MYQIDLSIFRWLNSWAGINDFYDWGIIFKAEYLLYVMIVAVFAFFVFDKNQTRVKWVIVHAFSAGILARFIFKPIIVLIWDRARPFAVLQGVHQLISESTGGAMPSGHAAFSFAVAFAVYYYYPKTSILFFLAAVSMGLARVAAGVHWPSDIFVGAVVGIFSAWLLEVLFKKLQYK
ncbi:MAG: phosphatase PAP2 family protein [bacterium]|nr:phosphatase PAP2 family protein [bacterium]